MVGSAVTFARIGMTCEPIVVEADLKRGLPGISVTGMLSQEAKEARERITPAITNSGFDFPAKKITINFSPAETPKMGTHYDLAMAVSILRNQEDLNIPEKSVFFGELSLGGDVKWVRGLLPLAVEAWKQGYEKIYIPYENRHELFCIPQDKIVPVRHLSDIIEETSVEVENKVEFNETKNVLPGDFSDIKGQDNLIFYFLLAAAGNHHMLVVGPPGTGKTMCASRLPGIMPDLTPEEVIAVNMIYSIASQSSSHSQWISNRPFRSPHSNSSMRALIGGGPKILPGEISLAHKGILFLDEFLEFHSDVLQALRTVLERKEVFLSMRNGASIYPADFLLIAAANPCPCGYYETDGICRCTMHDVVRYRRKLQNPLTDRIDIQIQTDCVKYRTLNTYSKYSSAEMKLLVEHLRKKQAIRYTNENFYLNSDIPADKIRQYCPLTFEAEKLLEKIMDEQILSARGCHKILRLARTLADFKDEEVISESNIRRASQMRCLDISL